MKKEIFYDALGEPYVKPPEIDAVWRPSVYAVTQDTEHKVLLIKPSWNDRWELPGGGVNKGEKSREALHREVLEETGYHIASISDVPIHIGEYRFYLRRSEQYCYTICLSYTVMLDGEPRDTSMMNVELPGEVAELRWVSLVELTEQNCHPIVWPVIKLLS